MMKFKVETLLRGYKIGPTLSYEAEDDDRGFNLGWEFAKNQEAVIAFGVSKKVGRKKIFIQKKK